MPHELRHCVWELTLRCNAACVHCGSDAGPARPGELLTAEALSLCDQLAALGCRVVTLSGGEPLLREDWDRVAGRLVERGVRVELISNGLLVDDAVARRCAALPLASVSMSVDGPEAVHDELRGVPGAFRKAMEAAGRLRGAGVRVGAVTQVCQRNLGTLAQIEDALAAGGFEAWQIQLTNPVGRAERACLALEPYQVPQVTRFILGKPRVPRYAADDIGWMTPEEPEIRSSRRPTDSVFTGCSAGLSLVGIASDGTVRGCLSMPSHFDEGSVRRRPLAEIWNDPDLFAYNRRFSAANMTGLCRDCPFGSVCRGGCKALAWTSQRTFTENRYCLRHLEPA